MFNTIKRRQWYFDSLGDPIQEDGGEKSKRKKKSPRPRSKEDDRRGGRRNLIVVGDEKCPMFGLMINEREFVNERMIHSRAHCPSKFSDGSALLSAVSARIVAAPPCTMKRSKIFGGGKKKKKREEKSRKGMKEKGREARPGVGQWRYSLHDLGNEIFAAANDNRGLDASRFLSSSPDSPFTLLHACQKISKSDRFHNFSPTTPPPFLFSFLGIEKNEIKPPITSLSGRS